MLVAQVALCGLAAAFAWRIIGWVREAPAKPDPWDAETEQKLSAPETLAACHRCSTPLTPNAWFCPHCGCAVGQYNNLMPYVQIFSEGEVFRNGVNNRFRNRPLVAVGFVLITLAMSPVLAPFYWFLLFKNLRHAARSKPDEPRSGIS